MGGSNDAPQTTPVAVRSTEERMKLLKNRGGSGPNTKEGGVGLGGEADQMGATNSKQRADGSWRDKAAERLGLLRTGYGGLDLNPRPRGGLNPSSFNLTLRPFFFFSEATHLVFNFCLNNSTVA